MTLSEYIEILQNLEADGHGEKELVYRYGLEVDSFLWLVQDPEIVFIENLEAVDTYDITEDSEEVLCIC